MLTLAQITHATTPLVLKYTAQFDGYRLGSGEQSDGGVVIALFAVDHEEPVAREVLYPVPGERENQMLARLTDAFNRLLPQRVD